MTENKRYDVIYEQENKKLKKECTEPHFEYYTLKGATDKLNELADENEQLKFERDRYKRLSEIRQESINNRILTIKEFIDNCSDKKVKKTLEQLFHSEVKEYDLSKKIRKLEKENEQLKGLIKKTLETTPIEHTLAMELKNSVRELYD